MMTTRDKESTRTDEDIVLSKYSALTRAIKVHGLPISHYSRPPSFATVAIPKFDAKTVQMQNARYRTSLFIYACIYYKITFAYLVPLRMLAQENKHEKKTEYIRPNNKIIYACSIPNNYLQYYALLFLFMGKSFCKLTAEQEDKRWDQYSSGRAKVISDLIDFFKS
ncbi:hypothetical protein BDA99DRAFT_542326 [Phascolomyces articulosus]|uniref:Uncharacterized protein n=1 Tax=Phascolomyces articulosus TaxID=60185 RepID=A0AAD5P963_9FUNG|nr:hypothetical protein BDA99DRAFT_542326 [Phascolomyces articulosus]